MAVLKCAADVVSFEINGFFANLTSGGGGGAKANNRIKSCRACQSY